MKPHLLLLLLAIPPLIGSILASVDTDKTEPAPVAASSPAAKESTPSPTKSTVPTSAPSPAPAAQPASSPAAGSSVKPWSVM